MITGVDPTTVSEPGDPRIPALVEQLAIAYIQKNLYNTIQAKKEIIKIARTLYSEGKIKSGDNLHKVVKIWYTNTVEIEIIWDEIRAFLPEPSTPAAW